MSTRSPSVATKGPHAQPVAVRVEAETSLVSMVMVPSAARVTA